MPVLDSLPKSLFVGYPLLDVASRDVVMALWRLGQARERLRIKAALYDLTGALAELYEVRIDLMASYDFPGQAAYRAGHLQLKRFLEMEVLAVELGVGAGSAELVAHIASWLKADAKTHDRPLVAWLRNATPAIALPVGDSLRP